MIFTHLFLGDHMKQDTQTQSLLTITQLSRSIKNLLENEYRFVRVMGEISNFKTPYSGHSYFSLKDSHSQIRAVLFKNQKRYLTCKPMDGQQVICFGRISVYEPRGDYQLIVDTVELYGIGNLQREFEKLKEKLSCEGLFSEQHKKKIPPHPAKIAIISSPTGAALKDFLKIADTLHSPVHFQILPVKVQGRTAASEISKAIRLANTLDEVEIIVLCRGGGSIEDLWSFNEEEVARAIFNSRIPVVTGIGHEIDFTIADLCADLRCPTPTAAASRTLPDTAAVKNNITLLKRRLLFLFNRKYSHLEEILRNNTKHLGNLNRMFDNFDLRLNLSETYLHQANNANLLKKERHLSHLLQKLESHAPLVKLELREQKLNSLLSQLTSLMQTHLNNKESDFTHAAAVLNSVSPLATLARGYSIVTKINTLKKYTGIISDAAETTQGDDLEIFLHKGRIQCSVTKVH